jgi:large subunit ribosomal protein L35
VPKLKTHKGAKRRFKITATGKVLRMAGNKRHLKAFKSKRALHKDEKQFEVGGGMRAKVKGLLPYGLK